MIFVRLLLRSLWRFRRTNLGVMLGAAVATAVITGALIVGDSMRYTLQRTADQRLGEIDHALIGGDRFFTQGLVDQLGPDASGAVMLTGVVSTPDGKARANEVVVTGIDKKFASMLGGPLPPPPGQALLNQPLMDELGVKEGDLLNVRVPAPSALPIDASLVNASKDLLAITVRVAKNATVSDDRGGRFSLRAEQRTPMNLFVDSAWLAEELELPGRVNIALMPDTPGAFVVTLDDLDLKLDTRDGGAAELTTPRVFLDASIERDLADLAGTRLLTYLVNRVEVDRQSFWRLPQRSHYAMVCASNGVGGLSIGDDEIVINTELRDALGAGTGDTLKLTYYLPDEGDRLVEATATLRVVEVVEIEGPFADRSLTPDFPGLTDANDDLGDWDAGPAIKRSLITDRDEAYWDTHRATPKAFISLKTGQRLWSNRFGTLTAIRFDVAVSEDDLLQRIDPAPLGFDPIDIGAQAKAAAKGTVDFGQLFLSLSGFIIIASVVLTATLFAMSVEQRARQLGTLLALGLTRRRVGLLLLGEAALVALIGAALGLYGGVLYARLVVGALASDWAGAVAQTPIVLHMTDASLLIGPLSAVAVSLLTVALVVWALTRKQARDLLAGAIGKVSGPPRIPMPIWMGLALVMASSMVFFIRPGTGMKAALGGFAAGGVMFAALLCLVTGLLSAIAVSSQRRRSIPQLTAYMLAGRNLTRRRGRTLAAVVTLGCGVFLVFAVSGFRLSAEADPDQRASGTGGFALVVETTQPVRYDLNTQVGRDHYFLDEDELPRGSVVPFRVSAGDDASCLNLNQTATPRVLGVDADLLAQRRAFTFMAATSDDPAWRLLDQPTGPGGAVPAIADANTAQWAIKLGLGDTLTLTDGRGQPYDVQLVATLDSTILQGSLIISDTHFERLYPDTSGYRMMLVDAPGSERANVAALLEQVMVDDGVTVTPAADRLAEYHQVQNTYLTIFQALGGLGVVLGALGVGVIAARNLLERRPELALMDAVGIGRGRIFLIAGLEHVKVLVLGLLVGLGGAYVATMHTGKPLSGSQATAVMTVGAVLLAGLIAVAVGLLSAASGRLTEALRND